MIGLMNIYFVGNSEDPTLLPGVGMGNMLLNVLVFALAQGLNGAIETFVAPDWSTAIVALKKEDRKGTRRAQKTKEYMPVIDNLSEDKKKVILAKFQLCGQTLNRGRTIVTLVVIPMFIMFLWMDKILIAIRQSESVSIMGGQYVVLATPGAFFFV
jgi:hypothetical protein